MYPSKCVFWNTVMATYAERGLDELPRILTPRTRVNKGKKRKGLTITELLENPVVRTFYPTKTVGRSQGLVSARSPQGQQG